MLIELTTDFKHHEKGDTINVKPWLGKTLIDEGKAKPARKRIKPKPKAEEKPEVKEEKQEKAELKTKEEKDAASDNKAG